MSEIPSSTVATRSERRSGGSDARVIMGSDERALQRLWSEKRGLGERAGGDHGKGDTQDLSEERAARVVLGDLENKQRCQKKREGEPDCSQPVPEEAVAGLRQQLKRIVACPLVGVEVGSLGE
jgi:hypothetical protein